MSQKRLQTIGITVLILFSMSVGTILTKKTFSSINPFTYMWMALTCGIVTMLIYTFVIRKERIPRELMTRKVWMYVIQIGCFNFIISRAGIFALNYLPAITKTYLSNFVGFITMAMSCIILREIPSKYQILGALIAFAGLRVFFLELPRGGEVTGVLLILATIFSTAYTNNLSRKLAIETDHKISNNIISTLAITIGGTLMVIICMIAGEFPPVVPSTFDWVVILYTGIVTTAVGLTTWNFILHTLRSYEASILGATTVIWTSILAVIFLHERLVLNQMIGIMMMLTGICLVQVRKLKQAESTR